MRFITVRKRNILLGILLICFVWFGYLSLGLNNLFHQGETNEEEAAFNDEKLIIGETVTETETVEDIVLDEAEMVSAEQNTVNSYDDYFVNYRIEREKIRSQQVELLREIVNNPSSINEVRKNAQEKMLTITQNMENELKLENLIKAKNFKDAVVLIQPESVMVVVKVLELANEDGMKIADLVANTTGHNYEDIIITTKE